MLPPSTTRLGLACLAACLLAPAPTTAQDSVRLRNGATETGRIESESYDGLLLKTRTGNQEKQVKHSWEDVVHVTYGGAAEYTQAVNQIATGNLGTAIPKLTSMAANAALRKELKPHVMFQLAAALQRAGKLAEAATAYAELVSAFPKTQHLRAAAQGVVECHIGLGDPVAGTAALESLLNTARKGSVDDVFLSAFDYYRGRLLEAQKDIATARQKYQSAVAVRVAGPALVASARLGIARCEQAEGRVEQARETYKALIQLDVGNEVLAGAWNGLADLTRDEGIKANSAEKLTDALFMYLRGVVEYGPAPGEGTGEYERALAGASRVFQKLSELESDEAKKKQYAQRARQRLDQLRKEFPNSPHLGANTAPSPETENRNVR